MSGRRSNPVEELVFQCKAAGLPEPWPEFRFHMTRRWRFDLAWEDQRVAVEVDGGVYLPGGSRHTRGAGYERDCEKLNEAATLGYRVLRVTPRHIREGKALAWIEQLLK